MKAETLFYTMAHECEKLTKWQEFFIDALKIYLFYVVLRDDNDTKERKQ